MPLNLNRSSEQTTYPTNAYLTVTNGRPPCATNETLKSTLRPNTDDCIKLPTSPLTTNCLATSRLSQVSTRASRTDPVTRSTGWRSPRQINGRDNRQIQHHSSFIINFTHITQIYSQPASKSANFQQKRKEKE